MKQVIKLTTKQWKKYDSDEQELILQKYDVVLTDHETTNEKLTRYGKAINFKNYQKGMKKFDSVMKGMDKFWKDFDKQWSKSLGSSKGTNKVWNTQKRNKESRTKRKDNISLIYGKPKTKVKVF